MLTPAQQLSFDLFANLVTSYRLVYLAIALALLVELICFQRVRCFNSWFTLLAGAAVCLQTVIVVVYMTLNWDDAATMEALLKVNMLGYSGVALVGAWLGARRVWLERSVSRAPMAYLRGLALAFLIAAFAYQVNWGLGWLELLSMARTG